MRSRAVLAIAMLVGCGGAQVDAHAPRPVVAKVATIAPPPEPKRRVVDEDALQRLPIAEALPAYREWARDREPARAVEGLSQLGWAKDDAAIPSAVEALESADHEVRATAARVSAAIGAPKADAAKPALRAALAEATKVDRSAILTALVSLGDRTAVEAAIDDYRRGQLEMTPARGGWPALGLGSLARAIPADRGAELAGETPSPARDLGLAVVARDAGATAPASLVAALESADGATWSRLLDVLARGAGGVALVHALAGAGSDTRDKTKGRTQSIFDRLAALEDPRVADALARYIGEKPEPHWRSLAAARLAALGDLRAVPALAWRLDQDPLRLYRADLDPELRASDVERVVAARALADLATMHPDRKDELRKQAAPAARRWMLGRPQPHANGLCFAAAVGARELLPELRRWASPAIPLPKEGAQAFPPEFATAQSALRYVGAARDPRSWTSLDSALARRPAKIDATLDGLLRGGNAVLGMALRALGVGAADGFAEWGDPKAYPLLLTHVEDPLNNEQSRLEAGAALAWVATDAQLAEIASKVRALSKKDDARSRLLRACYLEALARRPVPSVTAALVDVFGATPEAALARAVGGGGLAAPTEARLYPLLAVQETRRDAALALLLGASPDGARRAVLAYGEATPEELDALKVAYSRAFDFVSDASYERGDLARWTSNAEAASRVKLRGERQEWPRQIVERALEAIDLDRGPRSLTRAQLRFRLLRDARSPDETRRADALRILRFVNERGVLLSLGEEPRW